VRTRGRLRAGFRLLLMGTGSAASPGRAGTGGPPAPEIVRVLVDNHARFLAFLQRRVASRDTAEDILQDAFVRGIGRAASLRERESAMAWFYRLLRNALADHYRRQGVEQRALTRAAAEPAGVEPPVDQEMMGTVCECVRSLVETLRPAYAEAIRRVDLDGATLAQLAAEARITPNAAGVRIHRARRALKRQLERCCATCATHGCIDCRCEGTAASPR